ncbi:MAG: helix-turn-helix transcriptional regulator [Clostridia bacterium]|nr:helix-turn-helix transcriptional regulator [Clostridia bacterium]
MKYVINPERGISDFFYCQNIKNYTAPPHVHSHIEFAYITDGCLNVTIGENNLELVCGDMAIIMPYEIHSYKPTGDSKAFIIACPPNYFSEYKEILSGKVFVPPYTKFCASQNAIISEIIENDFKDDLKKKALIYCSLSDFLNSCELQNKKSFEYDLYRKAIVYISENYKENLTLKKTAFDIGVTASHLSRVLNSDEKPGFTEILNSLRINAAKRMLQQQNIPITEIALETGFGSIRNFNRIFKKYFGMNPRDVRKK